MITKFTFATGDENYLKPGADARRYTNIAALENHIITPPTPRTHGKWYCEGWNRADWIEYRDGGEHALLLQADFA